jgi:two-component system sensor histidine kinase and response regulator WspE
MRALLVEIAGEPYAIPLSQIHRTLKLRRAGIANPGGRPQVHFAEHAVALFAANQVLECGKPAITGNEIPVIILSDRNARYGLTVDRFLGERELVVQPLDPRLGKIGDISAAALMEDGTPVLIIDVDELLHSMEKRAAKGDFAHVPQQAVGLNPSGFKRVLAVDDSLTVRELERKLLSNHGYQVDVASDGLEAWNALCSGDYDLVITDIDMPRMGGIELATLIKAGAHFKSIPVLIVTYKEGEEERLRGMQAGADYYLAKGAFHDETLLQAVTDLIGGPDA